MQRRSCAHSLVNMCIVQSYNLYLHNRHYWEFITTQIGTVNVWYLAGTIFGGKWFFNNLAWICIGFFNVLILKHVWKAFGDVLELAEAAFHQKRKKEYTSKCNTFTVTGYFALYKYSHRFVAGIFI